MVGSTPFPPILPMGPLVSYWLRQFRHWTMQLPSSWGLGQSKIHFSLLVTLTCMAVFFLVLSQLRPSFEELQTAALSMPVIWLASLIVRIASQQLAIGELSEDSETVVGPSGNLQTDYEYLPTRAVFSYSIAGQLASLGLISVGLMVNGAMSSSSNSVTLSQLLDLHGGWGSRAWASQIMWVNIFLFGLHLLPTVPFDMRATVLGFFSLRSRNAQEPYVFRRIAAFDTHLAACVFGVGATAATLGWILNIEMVGWYGALAAAVYLFVAGQWEASRAEELEEQYTPRPNRVLVHEAGVRMAPHLEFGSDDSDQLYMEPATDSVTDNAFESHTAPDIDEILRKLHHQGPDALSDQDREALLSASREIKAKRDTSA